MLYSISRYFLFSFVLCLSFCASIPVLANDEFNTLEQSHGRLGVSAIDTNNHAMIGYHATERFPMTSTFKFILVSAILKHSMTNPQLLNQRITYTQQDLNAAGYAPVTEKYLKTGMTIAELCQSALTHSDNAAANLLIKKLGGPQAVTVFARSIGDKNFRLDRTEPTLNTAIPGDLRDTTTPQAMAIDLQHIVLGNFLALPQRHLLETWLKRNTTGSGQIRAAVPNDWIVGDKTGHGDYGTTNDIGIIWPPHCSSILLSIYYTQNKKSSFARDDVIAKVTEIVLKQLAQSDCCIRKALQANS